MMKRWMRMVVMFKMRVMRTMLMKEKEKEGRDGRTKTDDRKKLPVVEEKKFWLEENEKLLNRTSISSMRQRDRKKG